MQFIQPQNIRPPLLTYFQAKKVFAPAIDIRGKNVSEKITDSPMHRI